MHILNGANGLRQRYPAKNRDLQGLRRSELIADLFNNGTGDEGEERVVKVRLSYTSQALAHELKQEVHRFLKGHKQLNGAVAAIPLPVEAAHGGIDLTVRKLSAYLRWLEMGGETGAGEEEAPFRAIHQAGLDQEIKKIFDDNRLKQGELRLNRNKDNPNYFYLIYPETYAFN